jgi:hypothetical protein
MDDGNVLRDFWTPLFVYLNLLGVYLLLLGIALAGLVSALKKRQDDKRRH